VWSLALDRDDAGAFYDYRKAPFTKKSGDPVGGQSWAGSPS
jgi:hypothetical protein